VQVPLNEKDLRSHLVRVDLRLALVKRTMQVLVVLMESTLLVLLVLLLVLWLVLWLQHKEDCVRDCYSQRGERSNALGCRSNLHCSQ
jgi:ferric-dicitrate binding protein FerR (iron transport regulator)